MELMTLLMMLFNGLVLGSYLVLLSLGLSIIFGMLGVVNFAQGALYMLGAYAGYTLLSLGVDFWLTLVLVPLIVAALAGILYQDPDARLAMGARQPADRVQE